MSNQILEVRGTSLRGILETGDQLSITETKDVQVNDLVIFVESNQMKSLSVKVCRAIAGDRIAIDPATKEIFINDKPAPVKLRNANEVELWNQWLQFQNEVPEGYLILLGTTDDAIDSRSRGYFSLNQVVGTAEKIGQDLLVPV